MHARPRSRAGIRSALIADDRRRSSVGRRPIRSTSSCPARCGVADGRTPSRRCLVGTTCRACRWRTIADVDAGRRPGQHHPDRRARLRRSISAEITERRHRRRVAVRSRPSSTSRAPRARSRPARSVELAGVTPAADRGASAACSPRWASPILLVYVMMVLTFNSLVTPFIILFTLPLATIGAFPALFLHRAGRSGSARSSAS